MTRSFGRKLECFAVFLGLLALSTHADIPARKLELIRQSMAAMKLDQKIQGMINAKAVARTQKLRIENPEPEGETPDASPEDSLLPDSALAEARNIIAQVYNENRGGRDGLDMQVYAVFDRYLSEDDLKFVANFNGSDNGKRYREVAPRIVSECLQVGQAWSERLEPEIRRRLEERFRGKGLKL